MTLVKWFRSNRQGKARAGMYIAVRNRALACSYELSYEIKNKMEHTSNKRYDVGFTEDDRLVLKVHEDGQFQAMSSRQRAVVLTSHAVNVWAKPLIGQDIIMMYDPKEDWYISAYSRSALIGDGKRRARTD